MEIEYLVLDAVTQHQNEDNGAYGFLIARVLADADGARDLIGHGTLYKALSRMVTRGVLEATWEDDVDGVELRRPRRRLYRVTALGQHSLASRPLALPSTQPRTALA